MQAIVEAVEKTVIDLHIDSPVLERFIPKGILDKFVEHKVPSICLEAEERDGHFWIKAKKLYSKILEKFPGLFGLIKGDDSEEEIEIPVLTCDHLPNLFGSPIAPNKSPFALHQ